MQDIKVFSSMASLVSWSEANCPKYGFFWNDNTGLEDTHGPATYAETRRLIDEGDVENFSLIKEESLSINPSSLRTDDLRRKIEFGVVGGAVCVPRMLSGAPNCMMTMGRRKTKQPVLNILFSIGRWCIYVEDKKKKKRKIRKISLTAKNIATYSAKLLCAIQAIERAGVKVNLYVAKTNHEEGAGVDDCGFVVKVKSANVPVSAYSCAFAVLNKAMHTRFHWGFMETDGRCFKSMINSTDVYGNCGLGDYIHFNVYDMFVKSPQDIIDEITKKVKA